MSLSARPATLDDIPAISELSILCEAGDLLDFPSSIVGLQGILAQPGVDLPHDTRLWHDEAGRLVGFALLRVQSADPLDGMLWLRVHPRQRDGSLADEAIVWATARLHSVAAERGLPARLGCGSAHSDQWRIELLERHGMRPIRYFQRMERALAEPVAPPRLPAGFSLRCVTGDHEAAAWAEMFNESFVDHWNFHPLSVELLLHIYREPLYRRDLDLVIVAPDGAFAAFCSCEINGEENERNAERIGKIEVLGTRRGYRSIGLGRAALLAGLHTLQTEGMGCAHLIVDADSPTGANRLYESAGFQVTRRTVRYARNLE